MRKCTIALVLGAVIVLVGSAPEVFAAPAKVSPAAQIKAARAKIKKVAGKFAKDSVLKPCAAYLRFFGCYVGKLPKSVQPVIYRAFLKSMVAWVKISTSPAKKSLGKTCQMATAALVKGIAKMPKYKSCVKGVKLLKPRPRPRP